MKNKIIKIFVVIVISLVCSSLLNNSYAGDACRVGFDFKPSNPKPGDEIEIDVSFTYIHDPVSMLSFSLNYDSEKFEYIGATATDFWNISLLETTFSVESKSLEATTTTGKIATIKLKVKDNAVASTNTIKVTNIQAVTDDNSNVDLGDLEDQIITIQPKKEPQKENTSGENTNISGDDNNTSGQDISNDKPSSNPDTSGRRSSDSIDESRIVTINGGSSSSTSAKGSDTSTTTKILPKTGRSTIITIVITLSTLGIAFSYVLYRKYKNI